MEIYDFNKLTIDEKTNFAWNSGTFIASIKVEVKAFTLYHTNNFYIEIEYDRELNSIIAIRTFKRAKRLDKYIDSVELEKLF